MNTSTILDEQIAPKDFFERLCLVKTSNTNFEDLAVTSDNVVAAYQLWPALKYNSYKELQDQLNDKMLRGKVAVEYSKLCRTLIKKADKGEYGIAYILGRKSQSTLVFVPKNSEGVVVEDDKSVFDFFIHADEIERAVDGEGYCGSAQFQAAYTLVNNRMEQHLAMLDEKGLSPSPERKRKVTIARVSPSNHTTIDRNQNKVDTRGSTLSDNTITSTNKNESAAIGIGKKPTPEQHQQMMAAHDAKQSSASSLVRGSLSKKKLQGNKSTIMKLNYDKLVTQKVIHLNREDLNGVDDLDTLVKIIEQSTLLRMLDLRCANLTLSDDRKLTNAIAKNTSIKRLWLQHNNISTKGAKYLANAMKKNNTLVSLYLSGNNIGDEGAKYIANMLAVNKTLQLITLSYNNIGDKGAESIATSLVVNTGIRRIDLRCNSITNAGAKKLVDALEDNHSIEGLRLCDNNISNQMMNRIKAILNDTKRDGIMPKSSLLSYDTAVASLLLQGSTQQQGRPLTEQEKKKEKEKFLTFIRVLMKYLEQRDMRMHIKAKALIKECYEKNQSGDPNFRSLTTSMKILLRHTVGETYWKKAHDYLDNFLKQKTTTAKQDRLSSGGSRQQSTTTITTTPKQKATTEKKKAEDDKVEAEQRKARNAASRKRRAEQKKQNTEVVKKDKELEEKDAEIAKISQDNAKKDKQIASLKAAIRGQIQQLESILDPVDLTSEDESAEPPNKRARTQGDTPKSTLALQHEQIKEAVKVKEENINEYVDFLQSKIDELASVAEAGGADKDKVAEIKGRLHLNFDEFVSATAMTNMS